MPLTELNPLHRTDGSATYSSDGYSLVASVNGPMEVQRRDELPEEAAIDVAIRPASGVAGVRERHLESIIQNTLRHVILVSAHPRTLIQITLQIISSPADPHSIGTLPQAFSNLPILPALLQASTLALLATSIPMAMTLTATLIAVHTSNAILLSPSSEQIKSAASLHVFAFSSHGESLVIENEGDFTMEIWEDVYEKARQLCNGHEDEDEDSEEEEEDVSMNLDVGPKLEDVLRDAVQQKIAKERRWKEEFG